MKCYICGTEIGEQNKYCPGCGRVVSRTSRQQASQQHSVPQETITYPVDKLKKSSTGDPSKTGVYQPARTKSNVGNGKSDVNITDIFSSDPNTPEYTDPHSYDRATADVLNYDKMFMSGKGSSTARSKTVSTRTANRPVEQKRQQIEIRREYEDYDYEDEYEEQPERRSGNVIRDKKTAKPKMKINYKIFIAIAAVIGLVICITGVYEIGKKFELWGSKEPIAPVVSESGSEEPKSENAVSEKQSTTENKDVNAESGNGAGIYTVESEEKNIFMYKASTGGTIFATIPNKTVIKIVEISGEYGKTTYNERTGWIKLDDVVSTPNAEYKELTTAPAETTSPSEKQPGSYTVNTNGNGTLNVRSTNSTSGDVVTTITDGATVEVTEVKGLWGHVTVDGIDGWVYMEYLAQ